MHGHPARDSHPCSDLTKPQDMGSPVTPGLGSAERRGHGWRWAAGTALGLGEETSRSGSRLVSCGRSSVGAQCRLITAKSKRAKAKGCLGRCLCQGRPEPACASASPGRPAHGGHTGSEAQAVSTRQSRGWPSGDPRPKTPQRSPVTDIEDHGGTALRWSRGLHGGFRRGPCASVLKKWGVVGSLAPRALGSPVHPPQVLLIAGLPLCFCKLGTGPERPCGRVLASFGRPVSEAESHQEIATQWPDHELSKGARATAGGQPGQQPCALGLPSTLVTRPPVPPAPASVTD